jgi:5-methylcytosine-specific restriction endonuclease McrA
MSLQKPKKKPIKISVLKKKADKVFSDFIRQRDNGTCFTCGCVKDWKEQQNGHYISRSCLALRYDETNCHCQCVACNVFKGGNYTAYAVKMMEKYGANKLKELEEIKRDSMANIKKYGKEFYLDIIEKYK